MWGFIRICVKKCDFLWSLISSPNLPKAVGKDDGLWLEHRWVEHAVCTILCNCVMCMWAWFRGFVSDIKGKISCCLHIHSWYFSSWVHILHLHGLTDVSSQSGLLCSVDCVCVCVCVCVWSESGCGPYDCSSFPDKCRHPICIFMPRPAPQPTQINTWCGRKVMRLIFF